MARNPNVRGRQVVKFYVTGKRAAQAFGLPDYVRGIVKRYDDAKAAAVNAVSEQAAPLALQRIGENYTIAQSQLANRVRTANTPDAFRLFASSLRFPLSLFNGQWGGRASPGATAEVVRGARKVYAHAFIAPGRFRGQHIPMMYTRVGTSKVRMSYGRYKGQLRQKIVALRGPSTFQMLVGHDQGGNEKWVNLAAPLGDELRNLFLKELNSRYAELESNNG